MSQMVVYLRVSRKVANKLRETAPPEEWGRVLEELLKRAKSLQPKKAPRGEKVELELYLPKTLPRKLSARARVWGVSWDDVIWTLLTAKTDEIKRVSTKKASLKPKKKATKVTPPAPRKKRAIIPEEEDFEVVISPMKRIRMKEDIEATLEQLKALEDYLPKIESDIRFFTGDGEKAKRQVEEYRKEIRELERKLKKALDKIGKERLKESELDKIGMVIAEAEAFRGKIFDEMEAWEVLGPEDDYEPALDFLEEEPLSDEELLERYFEAKKASQKSEKKKGQEEKPVKIQVSESFRRLLSLAKDFGADGIYINKDTVVFMDSHKHAIGMTRVPAKGHFYVELPPVESFSNLESLTIHGNAAIWKYADDREYETNVEKLSEDDIGYRLAKTFNEAFEDTKKNAIIRLGIGGPKLRDKIDRTPRVFNQLKKLEASRKGDVLFWDALNGRIVIGNSSEVEENLKSRRDRSPIWKYLVGFPEQEWDFVRSKKVPALVALSTEPFEKIAHNMPEEGVTDIYLDRGMVAYQFRKIGDGKNPPIRLLQVTFPEEGLGKIRKYYERYERLPLQYRQLNALE